MTLPEHLRATRKTVCPDLVEYRTTDPRVVDAVRLLDPAADEIERLQTSVAQLKDYANKMADTLDALAKQAGYDGNGIAVDYRHAVMNL